MIVEDNVVAFPALPACGRPWVRIVSCNPAEVKDPDGAAAVLRLPGRRPLAVGRLLGRVPAHARRAAARPSTSSARERGAPPLPELEFIHDVPVAEPVRLSGRGRLPARAAARRRRWHNLESSVRATDAAWELPEPLAAGDGPLVYLSLGSLGSADVELMRRLVDTLADAPLPRDRLQGPAARPSSSCADNMVGEEFLPQTSILPQVDLVITHGGNNTVTECLHFGKPMVVLPLFWDQYDNAQRVARDRASASASTPTRHEPRRADRRDRPAARRRRRCARASPRPRRGCRRRPGTERAADLIERWPASATRPPSRVDFARQGNGFNPSAVRARRWRGARATAAWRGGSRYGSVANWSLGH